MQSVQSHQPSNTVRSRSNQFEPTAMTHIANCIRRPESRPLVSTTPETLAAVPVPSGRDSPRLQKRRSRLGSPSSPRTPIYQLWPSPPTRSPGETIAISLPQPTICSERSMALAVGRSPTSLSDTAAVNGPHQSFWQTKPWSGDLYRRRKVSVPELPTSMTTVQENSLDSPTIPGRPPLWRNASESIFGHERCSSAPGNSWRQGPFGDALISCVTGPMTMINEQNSPKIIRQVVEYKNPSLPVTAPLRRPLSPIISPPQTARPILKVDTDPKVPEEAEDVPPRPPPKSPSLERRCSPTPRRFNTVVKPMSHPTVTESYSAPALEGRRSPNFPSVGSSPHVSAASATERKHSPLMATPSISQSKTMHNRNMSDTSILDRGRPHKRITRQRSRTCSETNKDMADNWKLPQGLRPSEASVTMADDEKASLHKQSVDQAEKFSILNKKDVASLSRELRALDERCDYLRKTYKSLRDGRQKLHHRMISYLKRTDVMIFSRESLLKQEEALAELDISIDDWILKLEQAENRRLRVRQTLLEHVAAALLLNSPVLRPNDMDNTTPPRSPIKADSPRPAERKDVESIRIYADGRALDLFSDIEQVIGQMCETA